MADDGKDIDVQTWAIVELMGHRKLAGLLSDVRIAGAPMLRLDVPGEEGFQATQFYGASAVYCITPTSEETARAFAMHSNRHEPITRWELPRPTGDVGDVEHEEF